MNSSIRSLFPVLKHYTYLNSAAVAPIPVTATDAMTGHFLEVAARASLGQNEWAETQRRTRGQLAAMLNVQSDQIAFLRNTSDGFATIANGIRWQPGSNVVSFAGEFPANFYAWRRLRDECDIELRLCQERDGRIDLDELISLIDERTRLVTISAVQYASGYRVDLRRIGKAIRSFNGLFCVDITQAFGAEPLNLPHDYIDIACGATHKWLCGPAGCGILYLSDRALQHVQPTLVGWKSVKNPWDFHDRDQPLRSTALAWESGTSTSGLFYGLEQSLSLLNETGLAQIGTHLAFLSDHLCSSLRCKNYEIVSSRIDGEKSAIVCIKHLGGRPADRIAAELANRGVIVSHRGDRLRVAPHFFNNIGDIDCLVNFLP